MCILLCTAQRPGTPGRRLMSDEWDSASGSPHTAPRTPRRVSGALMYDANRDIAQHKGKSRGTVRRWYE